MTELREKILENLKSVKSWSSGVKEELLTRGRTPEFSITSLPILNRKTWGLRIGLNILAGRTSMGKSSIAKQFAWDFATNKLPTLFMSLEDDVPTIIEALFCQQKKVDNYSLLTGDFSFSGELQKEWEEFVATIPKELILTCGIGSNFEEVNYMIEALEPKPKVVIVDYVQAIRMSTKTERENLNEYIRCFRAICLKNKMCGILVSQMNRQAVLDNQDISLENLKGSGVLEEHCDLAILLKWDYFYHRKEDKRNEYTIFVAKNKRGKTGRYTINFFPEYYRFEERKNEENI